jgi:methylglutaconyl-CoA hydratase
LKFATILVADDGAIRTITLNRPERRNAITPEMQAELLTAIEQGASSDCRVIIFAGAGEAFCSGLDLTALQGMRNKTASEFRNDAEGIARLFRTLYELPKPTIAAVQGAAIAGGTGLATICDFTVAVRTAKFGYTEARIGFVPALVSAFLALQVGDKQARSLLLTGRPFDAAEAFRLGLVNEVVEHEDLASRVRALADTLVANSSQSIGATKRLLAAQNKAWLDTAIAIAMDVNAQARETADFREGIAAFLEKRKPFWTK